MAVDKRFGINERPEAGRASKAVSDPAKRGTLKKLAALGLLGLIDISALISCAPNWGSSRAKERRVLLLGIDGLDAQRVRDMMAQGKLLHMSQLQQQGGFRALTSTIPPQSPVAWATLITGRDPGGHGLYDFIQRDPKTYLPYLSIAQTHAPKRTLSLGEWRLPLSRGSVELLRRGRAFWELLDEQGIPCAIYRVPSNFPPHPTGAKQLAGLGAPDLRGTYGEFSFYTEEKIAGSEDIEGGGTIYSVQVSNGRAKARLIGPTDTLLEGPPDTYVDFEIWLDRSHRVAKLTIQDREFILRQGEWSPWIPVQFQMIPHLKSVTGICRFYLKEVFPHLKLYVTPINIDPASPALPITTPMEFARELAERFGRFYTQGFPEDVKALSHGVLDEDEYLHQSGMAMAEARRMYESSLHEFERGLLFHYFSVTDRTQHMFWRTEDPRHPAYDARLARKYASAVEDCYQEADDLVRQAMEITNDSTTLIVMSDHGFAPFYREFNLNTWLAQNGYLAGFGNSRAKADIFAQANWNDTVAYGLGFNGLYLNLQGREAQGSVNPADQGLITRHLAEELRQVRDPVSGQRIIERVYLTNESFKNNIADRAPDLILGYARGYRCSDSSVLGEIATEMISDNHGKWSADHCIDRSVVPGILLSSKPMQAQSPALPDVTASVLAEFEIGVPEDISGKPVW